MGPQCTTMCDAPRLRLLREILVVGIQLRPLGHVAVPRIGTGDNSILVVFWYTIHCSTTVPSQPCKGHRRDCVVCPAWVGARRTVLQHRRRMERAGMVVPSVM